LVTPTEKASDRFGQNPAFAVVDADAFVCQSLYARQSKNPQPNTFRITRMAGTAAIRAVRPKKASVSRTILAAMIPSEIAIADFHPDESDVVSRSMVSAPGVAAATNQTVVNSQ
jgi:hypothetical protein